MKLETFISYPPHYHIRKVIPTKPEIQVFTSIGDLQKGMSDFCNWLLELNYIVFQIEPDVTDKNQTDPEFIYLNGDILKRTLIHFRITPDIGITNEQANP